MPLIIPRLRGREEGWGAGQRAHPPPGIKLLPTEKEAREATRMAKEEEWEVDVHEGGGV